MSSWDEYGSLVRAARQRLESLRRAGLDRIPVPVLPLAVARPKAAPSPVAIATPAVVEPPRARPAGVAIPVVPPARPVSLFGEQEPSTPALAPDERVNALATLQAEVSRCVRCPILASTRTQTVFGTGSPTARLMFVGEAPGADEDRTGFPFVGRAGQLLTDMITKGMGLTRDAVYIANVLKSRPPENRPPEPAEIAHCLPYLEQQIAIVRPEFLCLLGKTAASALLDTALPMGRLRGKWHRYQGIATVVTYHPSYLLRTPSAKKDAWEDLQILMKAMGLTPPGRGRPPTDG